MTGDPEVCCTGRDILGDIDRAGKQDLNVRVKGLGDKPAFPDLREVEPALLHKVHDRYSNPPFIGNRKPDDPGQGGRIAVLLAGFCWLCHGCSERFEFTADDSLGYIGDVLEPVIDNPVDFTLDLLYFRAGGGQNLHACHQRTVDWLPDLGEEPDIHLFDSFYPLHAIIGHLRREQVIDLPDMVDRVLAACRFHAHRAVGRNQPVTAVATADGTIVTHLCRGAGNGQVDGPVLDVIAGIKVYEDRAFRALPCDLADLFLEELHVLGILLDICTIFVDNRTGNGQGDGITITEYHDLDILSDHRIFRPEFIINEVADILRNGLDIGKRGVADSEGSVVCPRDSSVVGLEDIAEIGRTGSQPAVHDDVAFHIQGGKVGAKIIPRRFDGDSISRDGYIVEPFCCTAVDKDENGPDDLPAAELRVRFPGYDLPLVGIVVQNDPKFFEIFPAQCPADRFRNTIGNTVRVTDALALDDFDPLFFQGDLG